MYQQFISSERILDYVVALDLIFLLHTERILCFAEYVK